VTPFARLVPPPRHNVRVAKPSARQRFFSIWEPRCGQRATTLGWSGIKAARIALSLFVPLLAGSFVLAKLLDGVVGTTLAAVTIVGYTATLMWGVRQRDVTMHKVACSELGIAPYSKIPAAEPGYSRWCESHGIRPFPFSNRERGGSL
jgi:hypothetical protein